MLARLSLRLGSSLLVCACPSPSDRNIVKLDAARSDYTSFVTTLMADLNTAWNGRVQTLGPAMAAFVEVERGFVELYGNSLAMIHGSNQLQAAPEGIALAPVQASQVSTPPIAQSLGPMPVSSHTGATNEAVAAAHYQEQQHPQQHTPAPPASSTIPYAQNAATTPQPSHVEQNPFSEAPSAPVQQQQPIQHAPPQEIAAPAPQSAAPIDSSHNQNPFEHEGQQATVSALSPKSHYEEESKRQRFAEEQKQHEQLA